MPRRAEGLPDADWPLAHHSRLIRCQPHRWHVQILGEGPEVILLHGAGGASHSWREIAPRLATRHRVIALDLPGHGFTRSPHGSRAGLTAMAQDLEALIQSERWRPIALIGHSAGAAVALQLARIASADRPAPLIIGLNPALAPFDGIAGVLFPMMAKLLAVNPLVPSLMSMRASPQTAQRLIEGTGSVLDAEGYRLYARLLGSRNHVNGTLQMMARWDLPPLLAALPQITNPVFFITGAQDQAVPPQVAQDVARALPNARVTTLDGLGHLAHEENPARLTDLIQDRLSIMVGT